MDDLTKDKNLRALWVSTSHISGNNAAYIEQLYERFLDDPNSVDSSWQVYFSNLPPVNNKTEDVSHTAIRAIFKKMAQQPRHFSATAASTAHDFEQQSKQVGVLQLINAYRFRGHQLAKLDPLNEQISTEIFELPLPRHALDEADLDTEFDTGSLFGIAKASLREILSILKQTYCSSIGAEYMHITDTKEKRWIQQRLESVQSKPHFPAEVKKQLLKKVTAAEGLERYLHTKYVGQKRFSLEGSDSLIPLLDELIQRSGALGVKEVIIGMAHRGRLNVLVNIMGKTPAELFLEFEGKSQKNLGGSGDVKYHMGFSSNIDTEGGVVHTGLAFNPSHLEIVSPVVQGSVRARQVRRNDTNGDQVVPVVLHGDASFAGQGVVMETLNMSQSRGFSTKGTIHVVVNNQIGFTTSSQKEARSTSYCTDVAKMVNAPIFHVNGDDPEAVLFITQVALDYRMAFRKDVVIDLVCYRRHGHNEADEPSATQPLMYQKIKQKKTTRAIYAEKLIEENILSADEAKQYLLMYRDALDHGDCVVDNLSEYDVEQYPYAIRWAPYLSTDCEIDSGIGVAVDKLHQLGERLDALPDGFELHHSVKKIYTNRRRMALGEIPVDWGFAETMAYATLIDEGYAVRLSGQDSGRGTFFHRHAILYNQKDGSKYIPLRNVGPEHEKFLVINSLLSEMAVLAFEYGYATTDPETLTIWEAQFGDFANGAQVVIDQFISAGEQKWNRQNGLVMLLPHGYEGQGPEHSSARLERFLQLCAERNMRVCMPTTAAQIFHLLRRQMHFTCRKPLIVMTPKSLLRHKLAASQLTELAQGQFQTVIPEMEDMAEKNVTRIILCSGKVYYDLVNKRQELARDNVAIIRVEELYPFPRSELKHQMNRYPQVREIFWCQEEPRNQGAWDANQHYLRKITPDHASLSYIGRPSSAASAVGYTALHIEQLNKFLNEAFAAS